jgi:hypothetical protein
MLFRFGGVTTCIIQVDLEVFVFVAAAAWTTMMVEMSMSMSMLLVSTCSIATGGALALLVDADRILWLHILS